jgi:hypothetical protein
MEAVDEGVRDRKVVDPPDNMQDEVIPVTQTTTAKITSV